MIELSPNTKNVRINEVEIGRVLDHVEQLVAGEKPTDGLSTRELGIARKAFRVYRETITKGYGAAAARKAAMGKITREAAR